MIQHALGWVISIAKGWVDDTVAGEQLQRFLNTRLHELVVAVQAGEFSGSDPVVQAIFNAANRLNGLGFSGLPTLDVDLLMPAERPAWSVPVQDQPVISQATIQTGVVVALLAKVGQADKPSAGQIREMEALLRYVEVRRQGGLKFSPSVSRLERWVAIQNMSLLFTRFARQQHDYRFLNAAMKLNDWAYKHHRHVRFGQGSLGYLQAVLEAEAALLEMTT
jgi:hypothetical protein